MYDIGFIFENYLKLRREGGNLKCLRMGNCCNTSNEDDTASLPNNEQQQNQPDYNVPAQGRHVQYNEGPPRLFIYDSSHLSEERMAEERERVKIAKRIHLINQLPSAPYDGGLKTRECAICIIDFSLGERLRYLPCMHVYHEQCIDDWLMRSFTCPSCMEPVDAALLSLYDTSM